MTCYYELEHQQEQGIERIPVHRKCVDKYCHKKSIQKAVHERADSSRSLSENLINEQGNQNSQLFPFFSIVYFVASSVILKRILSIQEDGVLHISAGKGKNSEIGA